MFTSLVAYTSDEFDWHYTKNPIQDWFVDFSTEAWKERWMWIVDGVLDDEDYFNSCAEDNFLNDEKEDIARQQRLMLGLALHPRLGANSPLASLTDFVHLRAKQI